MTHDLSLKPAQISKYSGLVLLKLISVDCLRTNWLLFISSRLVKIIFVLHLNFAMLSHGFSVMAATLWCNYPRVKCQVQEYSFRKKGWVLSRFLPVSRQTKVARGGRKLPMVDECEAVEWSKKMTLT